MDTGSLRCTDWDDFASVREQLLDELVAWAATTGLDTETANEIAHHVDLALAWKFGYGDQDLGRWTMRDVEEFLLEWCPAKVSASAEQAILLPPAVAALCQFLDATGRLDSGSVRLDQLMDAMPSLVTRFTEAMDDSEGFGRAATALTDGGHESLPAVVLPDERTLADSRAGAPVLAMMAALAQYVGSGRKLTAKGNLTLADARNLVELMGTGDLMDEQIGDRTFKTTSSAELPVLSQVLAWARKAGMVRVANGKVIATKRGLALAADPGDSYDRVVDALLALGPLASQRVDGAWLAWPDVEDFLDELSLSLLGGPYVRQRMELEELAEVATSWVLDEFEFDRMPPDLVARRVRSEVTAMVDTFELAGLVRRTDLPEPDLDDLPNQRRQGGWVEVTPAGLVTINRLIRAEGEDAPVAEDLAGGSAVDLIDTAGGAVFDVFLAQARAWIERRPPADAISELALAARQLVDRDQVAPEQVSLTLALMTQVSVEEAAPVVQELAADPHLAGYARCWLVDHVGADPSSLFDPDDVAWFPDALVMRMLTGGPEGLVETLALAGPESAQRELLGRLWRSPAPSTELVLTAIGEVHPTKAVAKAARKAALQHRTWRASR